MGETQKKHGTIGSRAGWETPTAPACRTRRCSTLPPIARAAARPSVFPCVPVIPVFSSVASDVRMTSNYMSGYPFPPQQLVIIAALGLILELRVPALQAPSHSAAAVVAGLDHVPIAVRDLEAAAETYRRLGFSLKAGRPHDNGIRNQHAKFPDGTELELITAPEARDPLTRTYRRHLEQGDGPAFLALFAPDRSRIPQNLTPPLGYLFFGPRNASPTDRAEHFAHGNSAESLVAVWLSDEDLAPERMLFQRLGATIARRVVYVPGRVEADVARFHEGEVLLLPASHQRVAGRRIVGVTLRVRSVAAAGTLLKSHDVNVSATADPSSKSLFIAPESAHGLWLELRERH